MKKVVAVGEKIYRRLLLLIFNGLDYTYQGRFVSEGFVNLNNFSTDGSIDITGSL